MFIKFGFACLTVTIQNSSISLSLYKLYQIRISKSTFGSKIFYILAIFFIFFLDFVSQFSHAEKEEDRRRTLACKRLSFSFSDMCGTHISHRQKLRSSGQPAMQAVCGLHG